MGVKSRLQMDIKKRELELEELSQQQLVYQDLIARELNKHKLKIPELYDLTSEYQDLAFRLEYSYLIEEKSGNRELIKQNLVDQEYKIEALKAQELEIRRRIDTCLTKGQQLEKRAHRELKLLKKDLKAQEMSDLLDIQINDLKMDDKLTRQAILRRRMKLNTTSNPTDRDRICDNIKDLKDTSRLRRQVIRHFRSQSKILKSKSLISDSVALG